jgi:hypothetical protein
MSSPLQLLREGHTASWQAREEPAITEALQQLSCTPLVYVLRFHSLDTVHACAVFTEEKRRLSLLHRPSSLQGRDP